MLTIYDFREWFTLVLLRNEAEATVRCFFLRHFTSEAQGEKHRTTSRLCLRFSMAAGGKHFVFHVFCLIHAGNLSFEQF